MKHGVISSKVFNHPLNPHHRMDVTFVHLLKELEEEEAGKENLVKRYLHLKGYYGHPQPGKLLPAALVNHLGDLTGSGEDAGLFNLLRQIAGRGVAEKVKPSERNQTNLARLYVGLLDIYIEHLDVVVADINKRNEAFKKLREGLKQT